MNASRTLTVAALLVLLAACADSDDNLVGLYCGYGGPLSGPGGNAGGPYMERNLVMSTGEQRSYILRLPAGYDPAQPSDVVFTFHGSGSNALTQLLYSNFMPLADRDNVIIVSPDANKVYDFSDNPLAGYWSSAWEANLRERDHDIAFIRELVDTLQRDYCTGDFFAAGMSAGGDISSAFQCLPDSPFKAYGPVTYLYYNSAECRAAPPRPMVYFHGTLDFVVAYNGGLGPPWFDPPVEETMARWATHNGCDPQPTRTPVGNEVTRFDWRNCVAPVTFYAVEGGGHTWPGAVPVPGLGHTTTDISATDIIWALFFGAR